MNRNQIIQAEYGEQALAVARSFNMVDPKYEYSEAINEDATGWDSPGEGWRLTTKWSIYVSGQIAGTHARMFVLFKPDPNAPGRFIKDRWGFDVGKKAGSGGTF